MYLVQLSFLPSVGGREFPSDVREMIYSSARAEDGLEHVSVSEKPGADPVIGLFLLSPNLAGAECTAVLLWGRAADRHPELADHQLFKAEAPLIGDGGDWPGEGV
ncbi:hypothetical protein [Nocardiopsis quinghaiensis]|uniref:hypothetical protein n=1 Tax=Nocardiopsis quinghaiensis TaxID=464995 RepID=UPI00123C5674|nr:hypothetical protein [Nocardiopsis quinghaiensis]